MIDPSRSAAGPSPAAVVALAERYGLPSAAADQLQRLGQALAAPEAPTTVPPGRIADDHLADALIALELPELRAADSIADLGSGAGVPGLVLAIARSDAEVTLVESTRRKCDFLTRTLTACGLANVSVVCARAEEWAAGLAASAVVTARAVAPLAVVAEYAAPLLIEGGALVAWRGRIDPGEEAAARSALAELGLAYAAPRPVQPYPGATHRHLQVLTKVAATPARFPRRAGMARKRPLGGAFAAPSDRRQR